MLYDIYHQTTFYYHSLVTFSHNVARIKPKESATQKLLEFAMEVEPELFESYDFTDIFGNSNTHMLIRQAHQSLSVTGRSRVEIDCEAIEKNLAAIRQNSITYGDALQRLASFHPEDIEAKLFMFESELISLGSKAIRKYALESFTKERDLYEATVEFMGRIFHDFEFLSGFSDVTTPVDTIFKAKKGVCQDFAQFAIAALRSIGLCAKYMSGYIETLPPEGETKLFGVDASHAWVAVYIPGAGWLEFDPTNNLLPKEQHIILGSGRDYYDIAPLRGVVTSSGGSNLSVMVDVRRVDTTAKILQSQQGQMQSQF